MPEEPSRSTPAQTVHGDENIQIAGSQNVVTRITNFFAGDTETQRDLRNRRSMLELVKNTWIKGVLEQSLYEEVLIELGLEEHPDAIGHPWDVQLQMPNKAKHRLPAGTSIRDVFDDMNGAMLILGDPGSGKTTTLLELARQCIARAERDDTQPMPVVLNLSSWRKKQTLDAWIVNELRAKYNVPTRTAQDWVDNDHLQLLLDGLDEVPADNREACVRAINDFQQKHGLTMQIVVCSRLADYEALRARLNLSGAILLQPLTAEQIEHFFQEAGHELEGAREAVRHDDGLQELVKQPLMLTVLALAYRDLSVESILGGHRATPEKRRRKLFDTYIQQMFERTARTKNNPYGREQTIRWLSWLALRMTRVNQTLFFFEFMQPSWLGRRRLLFAYRLALVMASALAYLIFGSVLGLKSNVLLVLGVCAGLVLAGTTKIELIDNVSWSWGAVKKRFVTEFSQGAIFFGGFLILAWILLIVYGVWKEGSLTDGLDWRSIGALVLILFGLLLVATIAAGLGSALVASVGGVVRGRVKETTYPGEKLWLSFWVAVRAFLLVYLSLILVALCLSVLSVQDWRLAGVAGHVLGVLLGMIAWMYFGGSAVIAHYILRTLIAKSKLLPWDLVPFLDYCVDRIFLRRVGGGYIFVHRLLMEHFAAMYPETEE